MQLERRSILVVGAVASVTVTAILGTAGYIYMRDSVTSYPYRAAITASNSKSTTPSPPVKPGETREPVTITKFKVSRSPPILHGHRSWFVSATIVNHTNQSLKVMVAAVNFDNASEVITMKYNGVDQSGIPEYSLNDAVVPPGENEVEVFYYSDDDSENDTKKPVSVDFNFGNLVINKKIVIPN